MTNHVFKRRYYVSLYSCFLRGIKYSINVIQFTLEHISNIPGILYLLSRSLSFFLILALLIFGLETHQFD